MNYRSIRFELSGSIAVLTLARPEKLNALTPEMADEMRHALGHAEGARAVQIRGEGRAFCSGADLAEVADRGDPGEGAYRSLTDSYHPLIEDIAAHPLPIVAEVVGAAAGIGCSLALACDFRVAGQSAYFLQAFVNIGLVPDGGVSWLLPRLIGKARAAEMLMLGERLPAAKAAEWGLVHECVADDELGSRARVLAERLAAGPTRALGLAKANLAAGLDRSLSATLEAEAEAQREAAATGDAKEGIAAFLEKRAPRFRGE